MINKKQKQKEKKMLKELKSGANLGSSFNRGWAIYKKNFLPIFLATLLALVIGGVSCGICIAPLMCGVFAMIFTALRSDDAKLNAGDVFKGFQKFLPAFVASLVLGIISSIANTVFMAIPIVGWIALIVVCYAVLPTVTIWSLMLVADQDASIGDAIVVPLKLLGDKRFWSVVLVSFVAGIVGGLGAIALGIGILVTLPLAYCIIAAAYEEAYAGGGAQEDAVPVIESAGDASAAS